MSIQGGLRDRLIIDNVANMIRDSLTEIGWIGDSTRKHKPVSVIVQPETTDVELLPNIIAVSDEDLLITEWELGSNFSEQRWSYVIDVYAESQAVGRHLAGDVRAVLEGRMESIGRSAPTVDIYDLTQATPTVIFSCQVEGVNSGRSRAYTKPYEKFWFMIFFDVVDYVGSEDSEEW